MSNPFTYAELHSQDPDQALPFYRALFDWKLKTPQHTPVGPYTEIEPGEGIDAGAMRAQGGAPSHWLVYIRVGDLRAHIERAQKLGARVLVDRSEVPDVGWFAVVADPAGAAFGMFEAKAAR
jgi:predicted enzyme related to lactoylglutathione lyase